jgi:hypothetical protein
LTWSFHNIKMLPVYLLLLAHTTATAAPKCPHVYEYVCLGQRFSASVPKPFAKCDIRHIK